MSRRFLLSSLSLGIEVPIENGPKGKSFDAAMDEIMREEIRDRNYRQSDWDRLEENYE